MKTIEVIKRCDGSGECHKQEAEITDMSVNRKGRRRIAYKNQPFVWWVGKNKEDEDKIWLNIVSEDKNIVLEGVVL